LSVKRYHSLLGVLNVKLAYMPSCIRPEVRLHLINEFCGVIVVKKCIMASSGSLLVFCTAWKQDTFGAYNRSYTFAVQTVRWSINSLVT